MHKFRLALLLAGLVALGIPAFCQEAAAGSATAPPAVETPRGTAANPWQRNTTAEEAPAQPLDPNAEVSIAFVKADLVNVLSFLSMASGVPIIVDAEVKGAVTITSIKKVPLSMAYEVINSALRVRGYTMVGTLKDKMIRVVPLKKAIADRATVQVGTGTEVGTSDTIITQVIPLQYISAAKLKDELKPLVADDQANLLAVSSTNTIIVTDTEGNVRRLMQIIALLDKDSSDVLEVEVYPCKFASAASLVTSLEKVYGLNTPRVQQPQQGRPPDQNNPQPNVRTDEGVLSLKGEMHVAADERTNALIISATRPKINMVLGLLQKLDIDTTSEVRAKVFRLEFADATLVANQLTTLFEQPQASSNRPFWFGGQQQQQKPDYAALKRNMIVADVRTNSVIVTATEQNLKTFGSLIAEMDKPNALSEIARSFQLKYAKAPQMAQTLTQLFRGNNQRGMNFRDLLFGNNTQQGDPIASLRNITVVADEKTNTLLITGPPQSFPMVENMIAQLDRRSVQVFIEVAIIDVTLDDTTKFGVEWAWKSDHYGPDGTTPRDSGGPDFGLKDDKDGGLRYSVISDNLQVLLKALTLKSDVKVYSTPSITTADNVPARISIGRDEPFVSSETETAGGSLRQTVDFKNVSITLNVTPHVNEASNLITLDVLQTINELIRREERLNAPIIANREAKTTVMVNDGQTMVIGGIIKENYDKELQAVPLLSRIPVIGELFKSRANKSIKSELMVFITPHILRDDASAAEVTEQARQKLSNPERIEPAKSDNTAPAQP